MDEIKGFIDYALKIEKEIKEDFELSQRMYLLDLTPRYINLQQELKERGNNIGVRHIRKEENTLVIHLSIERFDALQLSNIDVQILNHPKLSDSTWEHYYAELDGLKFTACRKIKNASATAPAFRN